ncbi:class I SAM-dependent methyltransferase [Jiangella endophytica]|uniref:class I SAM-dependent methyltransferase n=1 Tax=Jiangella endophytica TaxID=1623398 RepID=UPI000E34C02A|nr:class I SAM-dependent methyltransferase [Jiangella endophytica]
MTEPAFLAAVSTSYDTVADTYVERFPVSRLGPLGHAMLRAFAEVVLAERKGPVADVGCGPGGLTAELAGHGLDASGIDLSPRMIELARAAHPELPFAVGSMTALDLPDGGLGGLLAHFSTHHTPPDQLPGVFAEFHRTLAPGGHLLLGTHLGQDEHLRPTVGYGGHPVSYESYLVPGERIAALIDDAGLTVVARLDEPSPDGAGRSFAYFLARKDARGVSRR